ncbi:MAG: tRNA (guanine(46)-N(7))-methyltransferase [uncultured Frankineae bacterium]|uniref:tRNA (guanine-N(7)-)-methyltransferase n=1 Tax=uncultured Frankineae bacterium TaxID=437475 RepID=A0A6J4MKX6_9ACTN|nr:MAG: tRNA (guanine(46)-N(7))-methyltransferase [uncultured Frankineae bacterium]
MERDEAVRSWKARRRTSPGQAADLARLGPAYAVAVDRPLDAPAVFGRSAPLVLEIGSGTGEATAAMAAADPSRDVLAVEVHTPGVAALLRRVESLGLRNVRVVEADALLVLTELVASGSLDEVRVFFPDPWPKSRHAKRRLVSPAFASLVADRLRPGGRLHVATDWPSYAEHARRVLDDSPALVVVGQDRGERPVTRFEARGCAAGRAPHDLVAVRAAG